MIIIKTKKVTQITFIQLNQIDLYDLGRFNLGL